MGTALGLPQPNLGSYSKHFSMEFCSGRDSYGCRTAVPSQTLTLDLTSSDLSGIAMSRIVYDIRKDGQATLAVNGATVGAMPKTTTAEGAQSEEWVERSITFDPSLLKVGTNTFKVNMTGNVQFLQLRLETAYR